MERKQTTQEGAIEVEFTATLRYEAWEVDEFGVTEQTAIKNLAAHIAREPSNAGEFAVKRTDESSDDPASHVNLD